MMQPDSIQRPKVKRIDFIGLAAMRLEDIARPAKIQVQFMKNEIGAFKLIEKYIIGKFETLSGKHISDSVEYDN